ncbi:MAG: gluconate 2-dehydrogenase subunit 3 family protein [Bryobacteraceae bacterium]
MSDRREALKIIGAISATCAFPFASNDLYGQHVHPGAGKEAVYLPRYFSAEQMRIVSRIADLIIPPSDTPGAVGAGVPAYIDLVISQNQAMQKTFRDGIEWLNQKALEDHKKAFADLTLEEQSSLLRPLCNLADAKQFEHAGVLFFDSIKSVTADGYYTSKVGLMQELGYNGNTVLADFPTVAVPEH